MPEMDGYRATKYIREKICNNNYPVIVAVTANAMAGDKEKCLEEGMDDYLSKPVKLESIQNILIKWVKKMKNDHKYPEYKVNGELVVDLKTIQHLSEVSNGDNDFVKEIIRMYLNQLPELIAAIKGSVSKKDAEELRINAHSLKGASLNIGASKMAETCKILEECGKNSDLTGAVEKLSALDELKGKTVQELEQIL